MSSTQVELTWKGAIAYIRINRESRRNSLDNATIIEFLRLLEEVRRSETVCLVLTGEGDRAFCAGSDIKALASYSAADAEYHTYLFQKLAETLDEMPCATIAAIEGACLGGGLEIALACDYRVAASNAIFGFPEITVGALPTGGGTVRAPRAIGLSRSRELMLFGDRIPAERAESIGLVSSLAAPGETRSIALERAKDLASKTNRESVKLLKAILVGGAGVSAKAGHLMAYLADVSLVRSESFKQGVSSFGETPQASASPKA